METNQKLAKRIIVVTMVMAGFLCLGILFAKPPLEGDMKQIVIHNNVKLTSLTAQYHSGKVYLNWTVKSESDNNLFVIEKSIDESAYKTLAIEEAAISPEGQDLLYSVIDDNLTSTKINYRLYNVSETSKELMGTVNVIYPLNKEAQPQVMLNLKPIMLASR